MISSADYRLGMVNPLVPQPPKQRDTGSDCDSEHYAPEPPKKKPVFVQQLHVCHICESVGTWHDSVSCPCRFVFCQNCSKVGHTASLCKRTPPNNDFWQSETFWSNKLYSRINPINIQNYDVDKLFKLPDLVQINLVADKCPQANDGEPDLNFFSRKLQ